MSYTPKSKYQILQSSGEEYINPLTQTLYVGPYILTSEGAFIGNDVTRKGSKLIKKQSSISSKDSNIRFYQNTRFYNEANGNKIYNQLAGVKNIISTKNKPTEKDYQIGHYIRYFCKRNNVNNLYYEIDKITYKSLIGKKKTYDWHLYTAGNLKWAIDGDIMTTNRNILLQKESKFPNISSFFLKLNEFQKIRKTTGGELIYPDGRNYVGYYHVHVKKNGQTIPMVGIYHVPTKHKELEYVNSTKSIERTPIVEEPKQSMGYAAPLNVQSQTTPTTSSPSSTGGGSSGGGGGGY